MQTFLKLENRSLRNIIRFNTKILRIESLYKDLYYVGVLTLKRDYNNSIEQNIKIESLKKSSSTQDRKINHNSFNLKKNTSKLNLNFWIKEREWKEIWNTKFNKYQKIGRYLPTISDKLFFSYLQERKLNLKSKYTFNEFLTSSKIINYNFQDTNQKVDLNSLYKLLKSFFKTLKSLISFPILKYSPNKLKILLFYYVIPNKGILKTKRNYQNYIRKDGKLFKDTILRTKLIKIMARFKMILFISKWKENNNIIKLPNFNKKIKSLSIPLVYKVYDGLFENNNLTTQEKDILTKLELSKKDLTKKEQEKRPILSIKSIQYNLDKLIPFYKNLVSLLIEKDLKNLLDKTNHLKKIKTLNSNNSIEINKILVNHLLSKLSVNKDLSIEKLTDNLENLNIGINIEKENKSFRFSSIENNLQLVNSNTLNTLNKTSVYTQELNLIYSELIQLKEKIRTQDILKNNYKKNIVNSLNFLNKLILFVIKLKKYRIKLAAKKKYISEPLYDNLNFEIEGVEELNLENLEKFYHSYSNLIINRKFIDSIQPRKDIYKYLKLPTITEVISLIKEQKKDFNEEPLIMNYSNPYAYKNANLLLITALLSLYRAILIEYLNKTKEKKIGSTNYLVNCYELDKIYTNDLNLNGHFKNFREGIENLDQNIFRGNNESEENINILSNIKSNNGSSLISLNKMKFKYLISFLENMFNKTIELELIRLKYPAHNSHILAQVLGLSSKRLKFFIMMRKLLYTVNIKHPGGFKYNFNTIPSYLSGIKIRLGGRLSNEKLIPRKTVKTYQMGSIARNKINFKDQTRLTLKNKRGAYSFTVITSHIFNTNKKIKY